MLRFLYFLLFTSLLFVTIGIQSCTSTESEVNPLSFIEDIPARQLLTKALNGSGGLETWKSVKEFKFRKEFRLYYENGEVEQSADQQHHYIFSDPNIVNIKWENEGDQHLLIYKNEEVEKTKNSIADTAFSEKRAMNIILSSTFVMRLPYNLIDPTASIAYGGKDRLSSGKDVEVLQVSYDPGKNSNHSTQDIWWLYFSEENAELIGYMVKHADHYSYVENTGTKKISGLLMPTQRKSWRVDSERNPLYLRAEYTYTY